MCIQLNQKDVVEEHLPQDDQEGSKYTHFANFAGSPKWLLQYTFHLGVSFNTIDNGASYYIISIPQTPRCPRLDRVSVTAVSKNIVSLGVS